MVRRTISCPSSTSISAHFAAPNLVTTRSFPDTRINMLRLSIRTINITRVIKWYLRNIMISLKVVLNTLNNGCQKINSVQCMPPRNRETEEGTASLKIETLER